ncbi:ricin-type beta-trefoil lectin domain protein [Rhizoctonia solani]|uniref:Ricin-type beta-trefoil lectin domain protein n=1 Tax=Rhizoctonia solani TaxID=456999 RepID=A0A8H8NMV5_9AGAM|nr:ricin-type beta-trefoil lectin domain protein [Rhizoctonia solani]QRW16195.1 ricin-type beta-trefoil lectin domain protein [Rhizoctonia solani]
MGQDISHSQYPPDETLQPGTYRISNAVTGTAVQVSDDDSTKIVTWQQHDRENQQWFLQRSGHGYRLRNRRHNAYLAVSNTDNHALVLKPILGVTTSFDSGISVQLADMNRVLDLHWGSGHNGNEIHIWNLDGGNMPHRIWRVERIGDDFGEETTDSRQEHELSQLRGELSKAKQELSDLHSLLYQRDETIRQLQQDLKAKEEALKHARKTDEESTQLRHQHSILESKFQQQQTETASLQAKMDRVEYLMSQMMNKPSGDPGAGNKWQTHSYSLRGTGSFKYWDFEYLEDDTKRMTLEQFGTNAKEEEYKQEVAYLQKELKCASKQVIACGTEL